MLTELNIKKYRGIRELHIEDLGQFNIIAGANNSGKTSILEVIQSLEGPNNLRLWRMIGRRDGMAIRNPISVYESMKCLFPMQIDVQEREIQYSGLCDQKNFLVDIRAKEGKTIITQNHNRFEDVDKQDIEEMEIVTDYLDIEYSMNEEACGKSVIYAYGNQSIPWEPEKIVSVIEDVLYISPVQHVQNTFFLEALMNDPEIYQQFVNVMKEFDPGFISVNAINNENGFGRKYMVLSQNHKEGLLLNAYGDGMKKAMLLLSSVLRVQNGVLLLDEFETGIHTSAMESVFKWVLLIAKKFNVQIFMTSHSIEAIETVLKCCPEVQDRMRMITLVRTDEEKIGVRNVNAQKAIQLLDEYGLELR